MKIKWVVFPVYFLLSASVALADRALLLYAEDGQFLGCINCSEISSDSIWNEVGKYGNAISSTSIWNEIGQYGGEMARYSPFNEIASFPPKIVDGQGEFYGYLTANAMKSQRANFSLAEQIIRTKGHRDRINVR